MALLADNQVLLAFTEGSCGKTALFSLKNVSATDTVELVSHFKIVKRAGIVSDTGTTIAACTISANTLVTIPAGPANDGVWLLAAGVAS
jgi:hypothetical protein